MTRNPLTTLTWQLSCQLRERKGLKSTYILIFHLFSQIDPWPKVGKTIFCFPSSRPKKSQEGNYKFASGKKVAFVLTFWDPVKGRIVKWQSWTEQMFRMLLILFVHCYGGNLDTEESFDLCLVAGEVVGPAPSNKLNHHYCHDDIPSSKVLYHFMLM